MPRGRGREGGGEEGRGGEGRGEEGASRGGGGGGLRYVGCLGREMISNRQHPSAEKEGKKEKRRGRH